MPPDQETPANSEGLETPEVFELPSIGNPGDADTTGDPGTGITGDPGSGDPGSGETEFPVKPRSGEFGDNETSGDPGGGMTGDPEVE